MAKNPTLRDSIIHWRKKLKRSTEEKVLIETIHKLAKVHMTTELLKETGVGLVVRHLARQHGNVGAKATLVLKKWRSIVSESTKNEKMESPRDLKKDISGKGHREHREEKVTKDISDLHPTEIYFNDKMTSHESDGNQKDKEKVNSIYSTSSHNYMDEDDIDYDPSDNISVGYNPAHPQLFPKKQSSGSIGDVDCGSSYTPLPKRRRLSEQDSSGNESNSFIYKPTGKVHSESEDSPSKRKIPNKDLLDKGSSSSRHKYLEKEHSERNGSSKHKLKDSVKADSSRPKPKFSEKEHLSKHNLSTEEHPSKSKLVEKEHSRHKHVNKEISEKHKHIEKELSSKHRHIDKDHSSKHNQEHLEKHKNIENKLSSKLKHVEKEQSLKDKHFRKDISSKHKLVEKEHSSKHKHLEKEHSSKHKPLEKEHSIKTVVSEYDEYDSRDNYTMATKLSESVQSKQMEIDSKHHHKSHKKHRDKSVDLSKCHENEQSPNSSKNDDPKEKSSKKHNGSGTGSKKKKINLNKIDATEGFTSSEVSFEDCLGFNDIVIPKKKASTKPKTVSKKPQQTDLKSHKTWKTDLDDIQTSKKIQEAIEPFPPLPKNEPVDILSTLPQIQPNYRPLPQRSYDTSIKTKAMSNEDAIKFTSSRKEKTAVYSGKKSFHYTSVPSLFDSCMQILLDNIDAIEFMGGVPYSLIKVVLERCTASQLSNIEHYNHYLVDDTHELWEIHCKRDYRTLKPQENESWRELYWRAHDEREMRLKNITANISQSMAKSNPVRQVKLAYVDSVVKPPRDVLRKQARNGTAGPINPPKVPALTKKIAIPGTSSTSSQSIASPVKPIKSAPVYVPKKPKVAPLMAKTLKSMKQCFRR